MLISYKGKEPRLGTNVFIADTARVIGDVEIGDNSSIWYGAIIRGDVGYIRIGKNTNIQDNSVIHIYEHLPVLIGDEVTIGHNVVLHGCIIQSRVIIGIGAIVLDEAEVSEDCIIAAGSVVTPGTKVQGGTLYMGVPARMKRKLTDKEIAHIRESAAGYIGLARGYRV
ncbi:MAG: gamma carbonic anhydrase family protein [Candidatus Hydrogenedentota bacterium]